jgi:hypothetical protein
MSEGALIKRQADFSGEVYLDQCTALGWERITQEAKKREEWVEVFGRAGRVWG